MVWRIIVSCFLAEIYFLVYYEWEKQIAFRKEACLCKNGKQQERKSGPIQTSGVEELPSVWIHAKFCKVATSHRIILSFREPLLWCHQKQPLYFPDSALLSELESNVKSLSLFTCSKGGARKQEQQECNAASTFSAIVDAATQAGLLSVVTS